MRTDAVAVELSKIETAWTTYLGACRRMSGWVNGLNANKHAAKSDWSTDIDGVRGEMATAKWLGVYYEPRNMDFKGPDVGRRCQTRSTTYDEGRLFVRKNDRELKDQPFVLVITPLGWTVHLVGWLYGSECMKDEFWNEDCWQVPQAKLAPMSRFPVTPQKSLFSA